jgi:hypothetical protein
MCQERGPLSLVSTIEELLGRKSSGSSIENWEYDRKDLLRWPRDTLYPQKLARISPTSCGRSVSIVLSQTQATEFVWSVCLIMGTSLKYQELLPCWHGWLPEKLQILYKLICLLLSGSN